MSTGRVTRPGRLIAVAALAVLVVGLALTAIRIVRHQAPPIAATNGVGVGAVITALERPGDELCLAATPVPEGTTALQLWLGWHQAAPVTIRGTLALAGGPAIQVRPTAVAPSAGYATLPLASGVPAERVGRLCVTRGAGAGSLDVAGAAVIRAPGEQPATDAGVPLAGIEPSLRMLDDTSWSSSASLVDDAIARLANLSPSPLGQVGIVLSLFVLLPGGLALLLWNLATAPRRARRRVALMCVLGSLAITASWATITPSFQAPDEPEHFAYAQHLAETGRHPQPRKDAPGPGPYSTQLSAALALLRNNAVVIDPAARQPWTDLTRAAVNDTDRLPGDDGGGFTESASGHSVLYYALLSPAIHLAGDSIEGQLWGARLTTALLAALIAGLAAWAAGVLVPGRPRVAALAGLAAATIPMAGAVGGAVNNDTLVNLFAAAAFTVVVSLLARPDGPLRRFPAAGALIVALPLAKISGLGVAAAFGGATLVAALRAGGARRILGALATAAAGAVAVAGVLAVAAVVLVDGQSITLLNVHPAVAGPAAVGPTLTDQLRYIAQTLVPVLHIGGVDFFPGTTPYEDVYLRGLWGGFGWGRLSPPEAVFSVLRLAVVLGVFAGAVALWRERARWRDRRLAVLAVALTPFVAISFVAYAYVSLGPRTVYGEQGRYLLVALVPVSLWFAALPAAVPAGRWRALITGALAGGLSLLVLVGAASAVGGWTT